MTFDNVARYAVASARSIFAGKLDKDKVAYVVKIILAAFVNDTYKVIFFGLRIVDDFIHFSCDE